MISFTIYFLVTQNIAYSLKAPSKGMWTPTLSSPKIGPWLMFEILIQNEHVKSIFKLKCN